MLITYKTILSVKKQLTNNVFLFSFKLIDPSEINFVPGQYLILKVNNKPRLYSIASSNLEKNKIEFIVELVPDGRASTYLANLKEGEEVEFCGPAGQFVLRESDKQKIFLVTGTGIAPVRSIFKSYTLHATRYKLFWGLKNYKDTYLLDELKQYSNIAIKQFEFKICLSREQNLNMIPETDRKYFDLGHIDKCMEKILNSKFLILNSEFYLCGSRNVVDSLKQFLLSKNIPPENIVFEKF